MLRQPGSRYKCGRSATLLKVKKFHDAEARVLKHLPGAGQHKGRLGALLVEMANGTTFSVGTGFSDAERQNPPPMGSFVIYRYQELSDGGVPRFPSYVGVRHDNLSPSNQGEAVISTTATGRRRFEFSEGNSNKFWEISLFGTQVTVRSAALAARDRPTRSPFLMKLPQASMSTSSFARRPTRATRKSRSRPAIPINTAPATFPWKLQVPFA